MTPEYERSSRAAEDSVDCVVLSEGREGQVALSREDITTGLNVDGEAHVARTALAKPRGGV